MTSAITRKLIIAATLIDGILASGNINRAFVDMPPGGTSARLPGQLSAVMPTWAEPP